MEVLWWPTRSAPAMRFSRDTRKVMPSLRGDGLSLGHHRARQLAGRRKLADPGQRRTRQCTDRIEGHVAPELQPHLGADVGENGRLQAAADEAFRHALDALALSAVRIPDREAVALDLFDHPRAKQLGGRINDATDDSLAGNVLADQSPSDRRWSPGLPVECAAMAVEIPERNAVLHGHHDRVRPEQLGHVARPPPRPGAPSWRESRCLAVRPRRSPRSH